MADAPGKTQKLYRAAVLRILAQIEESAEEEGFVLDLETKRDALLYTAEALVDLAETMSEEAPASGRRN